MQYAIKADLRKSLLARRSSLSKYEVQDASEELCQGLEHWLKGQTFKKLALFRGFRNEPRLVDLEDLLPREQLYFPVVTPEDKSMSFHRLLPRDKFILNRYGIEEPPPRQETRLLADEKTIILVPGLAFDDAGYRLGYGAGYYDRYLQDFPGVVVGVCFAAFLLPELPRDPHDRAVQFIASEYGVVDVQKA